MSKISEQLDPKEREWARETNKKYFSEENFLDFLTGEGTIENAFAWSAIPPGNIIVCSCNLEDTFGSYSTSQQQELYDIYLYLWGEM